MTASRAGDEQLTTVHPFGDAAGAVGARQTFDEVQRRLAPALEANRRGSETPHVLIALPSYSVGESLLSHYADRIPALEHRFLGSQFVLSRIPSCELVFVSSRRPDDAVLDYYASLGGDGGRDRMRDHFHIVEVPESSGRSVAAKLLDRADLLDDLRRLVAGRPALIEAWNVTEAEAEVARRLGVPINGTAPELRGLGFKSAGRKLLREAGVPIPWGVEDVRDVADVLDAIASIRASRPRLTGVVVKLDDSGAGDGNVVLDPRDPNLEVQVRSLPDWYRRDLALGGVVEERITGLGFSSPSAQVDLLPDAQVRVLATHEQVLGGPDDQIYMGCRFPAEPAYAAELARHAAAVGEVLAKRGARGRISVDFVAARDTRGAWSVHALELNLRKGGTTHPYTALRNLVPGRYDVERGQWTSDDGSPRAYSATDNLVDPNWVGLEPGAVIDAVTASGLQFTHERGWGVVLHMLSGLAIDGRIGLTAIGRDATHAASLYAATPLAVNRAVR